MVSMDWKTISKHLVHRNSWWEYWCDRVETPVGTEYEYHYVHTNGGVIVVPVTQDKQIIFVRQYRYPSKDIFVEFPAGSVASGETYDEAISRELREETGYSANKITAIGEIVPYLGMTDEVCSVYVAAELFQSPLQRDIGEFIELTYVPLQDVDTWIKSYCRDSKSLAAWLLTRDFILGTP